MYGVSDTLIVRVCQAIRVDLRGEVLRGCLGEVHLTHELGGEAAEEVRGACV